MSLKSLEDEDAKIYGLYSTVVQSIALNSNTISDVMLVVVAFSTHCDGEIFGQIFLVCVYIEFQCEAIGLQGKAAECGAGLTPEEMTRHF